MPEEGLDDLAAISFGGTSQSQVLAERGSAPERRSSLNWPI